MKAMTRSTKLPRNICLLDADADGAAGGICRQTGSDGSRSRFVCERPIANQNADKRSSDSAIDLRNGTYNEVWYDRSATLLRVNGRLLTSRVVDPPHGRVPMLTSAARQRIEMAEERRGAGPADGPEAPSLPQRCLSPAPLMTTGGEANLLTIVQTLDDVVIYVELLGVRARLDDPKAYVQPRTMVLVFNRTDARMFEFACHEGNYSMTHILQAARTAEKQ